MQISRVGGAPPSAPIYFKERLYLCTQKSEMVSGCFFVLWAQGGAHSELIINNEQLII